MKRLIFPLAAAVLLVGSAFAQTAGPGQDRAPTATPATAAEKATAKAARKAEGSTEAKSFQPGEDRPATAAQTKKVSKSDRSLAAAKRKTEGKKVTKEPKDVSGPAS